MERFATSCSIAPGKATCACLYIRRDGLMHRHNRIISFKYYILAETLFLVSADGKRERGLKLGGLFERRSSEYGDCCEILVAKAGDREGVVVKGESADRNRDGFGTSVSGICVALQKYPSILLNGDQGRMYAPNPLLLLCMYLCPFLSSHISLTSQLSHRFKVTGQILYA